MTISSKTLKVLENVKMCPSREATENKIKAFCEKIEMGGSIYSEDISYHLHKQKFPYLIKQHVYRYIKIFDF